MEWDKKSDMRARILVAARVIFERFGYAKTTVDDIARQMGKGKSSIYYYYAGKEEIFRAVLGQEIEHLKERILTAVDGCNDPKEKLSAYVRERMHGLQQLKNLYTVLRSEFSANPEFAAETRAQADNEEFTIMTGILSHGVEAGIFRLDDVRLTAIAIVTALKGMEIPLVITGDQSETLLHQRLDGLVDILFYGILRRNE